MAHNKEKVENHTNLVGDIYSSTFFLGGMKNLEKHAGRLDELILRFEMCDRENEIESEEFG